jgi:hypothetical protein
MPIMPAAGEEISRLTLSIVLLAQEKREKGTKEETVAAKQQRDDPKRFSFPAKTRFIGPDGFVASAEFGSQNDHHAFMEKRWKIGRLRVVSVLLRCYSLGFLLII